MYHLAPSAHAPASRTKGQQAALIRVVDRVCDFAGRKKTALDAGGVSLPAWASDGLLGSIVPVPPMHAAGVNGLEMSAQFDAIGCLSDEVRAIVCNPQTLVCGSTRALSRVPHTDRKDECECVQLVAKQLASGKLGLTLRPTGGGRVFTVPKPGKSSYREVWHGRQVSLASRKPPKPRHLASPTALTYLMALPGRPVRMSKRDAKCWFDQLRAPRQLRPWFARPPVSIDMLLSSGLVSEDLVRRALNVGRDGKLPRRAWPVSVVWPMGYSWSSFVAQEALLSVASSSGLDTKNILSADTPVPASLENTFALATDDALFFSTSNGESGRMAALFDREFERRGGIRNEDKSITNSLCGTCVGVELEDGIFLGVPSKRCLYVMQGVIDLCRRRHASPKEIHSFLGVPQWYDLPCRPKLAVYHHVYRFVLSNQDGVRKTAPRAVINEFLMSAALGVFWRVDLRRPFAPLVGASDASTDFGFGVSIQKCSPSVALAAVAERSLVDRFHILDHGLRGGDYQDRKGVLRTLLFELNGFSHVLSIKASRDEHINMLEGHAFLLLVRWLLRRTDLQATRIVLLCDSSVWESAKTKGRSSTSLNYVLRRCAALELLGDIAVYVLLVPSAEMPADILSWGKRWRNGAKSLQPTHIPQSVPHSRVRY